MLTLMLLALAHCVFHEIGHTLTALVVGCKVKKLGLNKRGLYIVRTPAATPLNNALVSLAGPAVNIGTGIAFIAYHVPHAWVAIYLGLFNLLPLPHSDGTHAMNALKRRITLVRTTFEITDELSNLNNLRERIPAASAFGDDNHEAINAQIKVIESRLVFEEVCDEFESEGDYILSAARDAVSWLYDDDEAPSVGWADLAEGEETYPAFAC